MHVHASAAQTNLQSLATLPPSHGKGGGSHHAKMGPNNPKLVIPFEADDSSPTTKGTAVYTPQTNAQNDSTPSSTEEDSNASSDSGENSTTPPAPEDAALASGPDHVISAATLSLQTYTARGTLSASMSSTPGSIFSATV